MSNNKVDYYTTLEIPKTATLEEIKKAYKKLAIKWHPDKNLDNPDAVQKFRQISQAYEILSNEEKKNKYDLYGFEGPKLSSNSTRYNYADASDLFKSFFSSYGFDNTSDSSFFDAFLKKYAASRGSGGSTFFRYSTTNPTSQRTSYYTRPDTNSYYQAYTKYASPGSSYNTYTNSTSDYSTKSSTTTQNQQLPPEGQTIKKVQHVTRKFTDGTEETIQRTTIISSDGSKEITEENLDGTNKKTHYVLGTGKKEQPKVSSNFSGYNFGRRETATTDDSTTKEENKNNTTNPQSTTNNSGTSYTYGGTTDGGYKTYYATSGGATGTSGYSSNSYKIPSDMYANIKKSYSGGTKVYYADGSEGVYNGSFGSSYDSDKYAQKVYYTVRR